MIELETLILYALPIASLIFLMWIVWLEYRIRRFFRGEKGENLEGAITGLLHNRDEFEKFRADLHDYMTGVERRLKRSVQGVETIRFNPFKGDGSGGNQSFSTAFLDEEGNGVVISSLHARERVHMYSKPVLGFASSFELTEEEREAIQNVRLKISDKKESK